MPETGHGRRLVRWQHLGANLIDPERLCNGPGGAYVVTREDQGADAKRPQARHGRRGRGFDRIAEGQQPQEYVLPTLPAGQPGEGPSRTFQ